jgi:coiled-coil domain-containing protein 78
MHSAGVQKVDDVQERILQELSFLKQNPEVINRPGTAQGFEVEKLRKEKDSLMEENRKLKSMINEDSAAPTSGNTKYLKNKIFHLEKTLGQLEKERSELSVRTTMAEEQLKNLSEHLTTNTHAY